MATVLIPGPITNGCNNCDPMFDGANASFPGYVMLSAQDEQGLYHFLGRCYYCNHRDRPIRFGPAFEDVGF